MSEWLTDFYRQHQARHPSAKLPNLEAPGGKALFASWAKALIEAGVDAAAATVASERLILEPPPAAKWHFATLLKYAQQALASRGEAPRHDLSTYEGAKAASEACDRCGGLGLATVWHPRPSDEDRIPATAAAHCVCALGRWIRQVHAARLPEVYRRFPDLAEVIVGRTVWLAEAPGLLIDSH